MKYIKSLILICLGVLAGVVSTIFIYEKKIDAQRAELQNNHLLDMTFTGSLVYFGKRDAALSYLCSQSAGILSTDDTFQNQIIVRGFYDSVGLRPAPFVEAQLAHAPSETGIKFDVDQITRAALAPGLWAEPGAAANP